MKNLILKHYYINKEVITNLVWRGLQIFGQNGITFMIFILCAKLLPSYDFGIYNYTLAILSLLILFGDFGISAATSKYVAEYCVIDKEKIKGVLFNSGIIILGITLLITIFTLLVGPGYLKEKYTYVLLLLPLIFLAPISSLYDGIYRGLKKFKQLAVISMIVGTISIPFVYLLIKSYGLFGALISQNLFYFILVLCLGFGYKEFNFKIDKTIIKKIGTYSFIIGLGSIGFYMFSRIDIIFLGHYGFIEQINYFEIINKILMLFLIPTAMFSQVISPDITAIYFKRDYFKLMEKFKKYLLFSLIFSLTSVILIFLFSKLLLSSFLSEYNNQTMINIIYLMLIVFFTQFLNGVIPSMSTATGHAKLNTAFLIIFGIFHVILNYVFINAYGFMGIVYSIIVTKVLTDSLFIYSYYNILNKLKLENSNIIS